jgi:NADPH2:quinone reductase
VKPPLPFSPGCEAAGVIAGIGDGVAGFRPGDRVMAIVGHGAFAEAISVPADRVFLIPDGMDDVAAAAFLFAYGTAHHALHDRGVLQPGETLLVLGAAGGVGIAAVEIGKAMGARVIACASNSDKLAFCREHGADHAIDYTDGNLRDAIRAIVGDAGVDVVCDPVGGPHSEAAFRSMAWGGRFLVVGFAAGEIPRIALNLPLLKGSAIVGVSWGGMMRREPSRLAGSVAALTEWFRERRLRPHIHTTLPLERAAEAFALMSSRAVLGKVVLTL